MKAKELIDLLKKLPPDKKVIIRGYEDGYNDIKELREVKIEYQPDLPWYYGEYAISNDPDATEAIELFGENKNDSPL